ncbi:MAG: hypothetical protein AAGE84_14785 [Cyanobacteria bacterium P01_G01_bin.39]
MIKFLRNSETRLNFVVYATSKLIGLLVFIIILLPFLYWSLFISPVYSSLECERNNAGQVNCLLAERSAIALQADKSYIKNVRDVDGILRGLLNNKQVVIKANPDPSSFSLIGYQKKYYYPSTANTLIYLNSNSGFDLFKQRTQVSNFVRGKTDLDSIKVDLKLGWITPLFILFLHLLFFSILLNSPFKTTYDFDGDKKTLTIIVKRIVLKDIIKIYSFNKLKQVRLERDDSEKITTETIILQFDPDYDYPVTEFADLKRGAEAFKIIQDFIDNYQAELN